MSLSCLQAERRWQVLGVVAAMMVIVGTAWYLSGLPVLSAALLTITGFNLVVAGTEARWRLYGWRTPDAKEKIAWPAPVQPGKERLTFSLIVPVRDEAAVIGETLRGLMRQSHPGVHVIVSLCDDDKDTIAEVRAVIEERVPDGRLGMVIGQYAKPSKALQLNRALSLCAGDIVGVIDAEDDVAGDLLSHAEALFLESGADVVQGGVQLMNIGTGPGKWFQVHNVLEYFFWFTSRMAFHAQEGFVPLGGNTVFIKRDLLEAAGGWPHSLTEDCALGVKLCTQFGAKVATAYSAELTTKEEAPLGGRVDRRGRLRPLAGDGHAAAEGPRPLHPGHADPPGDLVRAAAHRDRRRAARQDAACRRGADVLPGDPDLGDRADPAHRPA